MQLGFIGLGVMGSAIAENLLSAGHSLRVFDAFPAARGALAEQGAVACAGAAEAAQGAEIVFLSLPNDKIVGSVLLGDNGVFAAAAEGTVIVDFSSIAPDAAQRFAGEAASRRVLYVDAPVSGGQSGAKSGTLTIMMGCTQKTFEKIRPVLETIGKKLFCLGAPGHGAAIKMINNLLLGCNMAAMAEALVLGAKYGLSAQTMSDIIGVSSGRSYALEAKLTPFIMRDAFDGGFAVDLQRKDLGLALDAARAAEMPLPMTAAAVQIYDAARAKGLSRKDISSLVKVWEELCGIRLLDL